MLFVHTDRTVVSPFCTSNVIRSVRSTHLLLSSEIVRPSSAMVSDCSLIGSPRCDFTFIRKVSLPARTRCVSRQIISRKISASDTVSNVAFPPCPAHFLMTHKTDSLSHSDKSLTGEPILPSRTENQYLARYWFTVCDGKIGSPVRDLS